MSLIIYGDIHGCYDEFIALRNKINPQNQDIEICVGDVITKGKKSIEVLRYLQKYNIKSVLGNHEDKILRYIKHQKTNKKNPIILDTDEINIINNLTKADIDYLNSMSLFIKQYNILIVHGGVLNHFDLNNLTKREKQQILRLRYVDEKSNFITYRKENVSSIYWSDVYDGRFGFVVYGHQCFREIKQNKFSIGLDTGCVYGNKLSAIIFQNFNNYKIISVKKEKEL